MASKKRTEPEPTTRDAGERVQLAERRREELLMLRDEACALALAGGGLDPVELRARLDGCKTAVAIHESLIRYEEQHGWLPTDAREERDWQQLVDYLIATARKHRLSDEVLGDLLDALGHGDVS